MPELPEVETVRASLEPLVVGRQIAAVRVVDFPGVVGDDGPDLFAAKTVGRVVVGARRRGKYLLLDLDDDTTLMVHLRMTGQLVVRPANAPPLRFEHLVIALDDGHDLRFADQRKFGRVVHVDDDGSDYLRDRLGVEPLSPAFTVDRLRAMLARRPGKVKSVLLDQRLIAGLGNIYVDEALFRARVHPERAANSLGRDELARLRRAVRAVLTEALARRGTSYQSFRDATGSEGENQANLRVYGRHRDGRCPRCGGEIERIVVGGRGTHFCPRCQRYPDSAETRDGSA